jgi:hypothetical protein
MRSSKALFSTAAVLLAAGTLGCGGGGTSVAPSSNSVATSGSSGGSISSTGSLTIRLTDSPFTDAKALLVTFSDVSVHTADPGDWKALPFVSGSTRTCDLKQLQGPTDLLGVGSLPAGMYTQIRLTVANASIYFDKASVGGPCAPQIAAPTGASAPVDIPSGEVKLNNEFTLSSAGTTILLDFDGDQSVHATGSDNSNGNGNGGGNSGTKYMMVPVIRLVSIQ